jgi:hypothetical protein
MKLFIECECGCDVMKIEKVWDGDPDSEWDNKYRALRAGEIIQKGDEVYDCHGWKDYGVWRPAKAIGSPAPDPLYPAHRMYRRLSDL